MKSEHHDLQSGEIQFSSTVSRQPISGPSPWNDPGFVLRSLKLDGAVQPSTTSLRDVVIDDEVWQRMIQHSFDHRTVEVGGILFGHPWIEPSANDSDDPKDLQPARRRHGIWIRKVIEAKNQKSTSSQLTFTHATWEEIVRHHAPFDPWSIVGWYHTHPNWGVFLSSLDEFICTSFFPPTSIAIVIDPIRSEAGCFEWSDDDQKMIPRASLWLRMSIEQSLLRSTAERPTISVQDLS